jgi:hypothetical protein
MVIAYSYEFPTPSGSVTAPPPGGAPTLMPVGLGILVARNYLADAHVLDCPSMRSGATTYYHSAQYKYDPNVWRKIVGSPALGTPEQMFLTGDVSQLWLTPADANDSVVGILSSYSYRDTPFYYDSSLDNHGTCDVALDSVSPVVYPQFMTPAFKTRHALKDRAICADSFDYGPAGSGFSLRGGLAGAAHKDGYNVLYGDNHVKWYDDTDHQISNFTRWISNAILGVDDLTISSPTSQLVWNLFDRAAGIDVGN